MGLPSLSDKDETIESLRMSIIPMIDNFTKNPKMDNLVFSTRLSAADRAFIRFIATCFGLPTVTTG